MTIGKATRNLKNAQELQPDARVAGIDGSHRIWLVTQESQTNTTVARVYNSIKKEQQLQIFPHTAINTKIANIAPKIINNLATIARFDMNIQGLFILVILACLMEQKWMDDG